MKKLMTMMILLLLLSGCGEGYGEDDPCVVCHTEEWFGETRVVCEEPAYTPIECSY